MSKVLRVISDVVASVAAKYLYLRGGVARVGDVVSVAAKAVSPMYQVPSEAVAEVVARSGVTEIRNGVAVLTSEGRKFVESGDADRRMSRVRDEAELLGLHQPVDPTDQERRDIEDIVDALVGVVDREDAIHLARLVYALYRGEEDVAEQLLAVNEKVRRAVLSLVKKLVGL